MIEIHNLTKTYPGRRGAAVRALADVSFECRAGEIFGLLGPNGAGKTTALRIISTALRPTSGTGRVMGLDIVADATAVRRNIGFLSSNTGLYGRLTAREVLTYFGRLFGMPDERIRTRIDELSGVFAMAEFLNRPCDKLSTGMRQKVNLARTVLHAPPVMVFDEPTAGLDVLTSRSIVQFVRECRREQRTVLFSTHIMSEVEKLCDRVGVLHEGRLHFCGPIDELRSRYGADLDEAFVRIVGEAA